MATPIHYTAPFKFSLRRGRQVSSGTRSTDFRWRKKLISRNPISYVKRCRVYVACQTIMMLWTGIEYMSRSLREGPQRWVPLGILGYLDSVVFEGLDVQQVRAKRLLCREFGGQHWATLGHGATLGNNGYLQLSTWAKDSWGTNIDILGYLQLLSILSLPVSRQEHVHWVHCNMP